MVGSCHLACVRVFCVRVFALNLLGRGMELRMRVKIQRWSFTRGQSTKRRVASNES